MSKRFSPTEYARQRAEKLARAKALREQRSRGDLEAAEQPFKPTLVSKPPTSTAPAAPRFNPTYDDAPDSLDAYASAVPVPDPRRRTGGYRELVTFGADEGDGRMEAQRRAAARDLDYDDGPTVSPGSDALSHEVRRMGSASRRPTGRCPEWSDDFADGGAGAADAGADADAAYNDWAAALRDDTGGGRHSGRGSRRTAPRRPEWNNDFATDGGGYGAPAPAAAAAAPPAPAPARRRRQGADSAGRRAAASRPEWNDDFAEASPRRDDDRGDDDHYAAMRRDLTYGDSGGAPPPQPSRRRVQSGRSRAAAAAAAASAGGGGAHAASDMKPKLALLKSKIRRSRSQRSLDSQSAGSTRSGRGAGAPLSHRDGYDDGDGGDYGPPTGGRRPRSGRRAAPQHHRPPPPAYPEDRDDDHRDGYERAYADDYDDADPVDPTSARGRPRSGRRAAAPTAAPAGGVVPATACTRQSGCPCAACAGAVDLLSKPPPRRAPPAAAVGPPATNECPDCHRKFSDEALRKHVTVCKRVFQTKRRAFNSQAARVAGTEAAKFVASGGGRGGRRGGGRAARGGRGAARAGAGAHAAGGGKKPNWQAKSSALREAMRANRMYKKAVASGMDPRDVPMPTTSAVPDDFTPCPHCGRTFNEKAAERHIPRCKDIKAKPSRLVRGNGGSGMGRGGTSRKPVVAGARRGAYSRVSGSGYGRR